MVLNSVTFLLFFFMIFILYYTVLKKKQQLLLIAASTIFVCTYKFEYLLMVILVSIMTYIAAGLIERKKYAKTVAVSSTVLSLMILFVFKYLNFSIDVLQNLAEKTGFGKGIMEIPVLNILLPVGISFYIFQGIGYIWDVYNGKVKAEKNFLHYFLFVSYFPKLSVGPIERAGKFLPQIGAEKEFRYDDVVDGLRIVLIGMFKKIAVADTIAPVVNNVFDNCTAYTGLSLVMATVLYAFQIYCDFSGYTDIAIGFSKMLGIHLMENFHCPYLAKSISEFWRRWHISLTSWFREFVYIPLGGNRVSLMRYLLNTMIVFVLSGIWHGASMNFIIWGALNGVFLCIGNLKKKYLVNAKKSENALLNGIRCGITFVMICFTWIFFRAKTFSDAIYVIKNMFTGWECSVLYVKRTLVMMGFSKMLCVLVLVVVLLLIIIDMVSDKNAIENVIKSKPACVRWIIYVVISIVILVCKIYMAESQQFIYFQF